ncbi:terpenoid cyclases/Protein prenyltransferase [Gonapodya prolifera JEL478]|uniref:Geranylgeranyl transferase type-2 subunit beta n=1 Tax=Gonapodya prolifera (strain JEL478) TaxID=1344416 RepID=A0A139A8T4_GONPJ|nr:terpenoid cyclases/Protein prenyltransferase [Gonapodya prolifera JEL478]|eukprot:KXS12875.1 terpenoid cyclases/Protein prenyltransferase [Gonapodya prolifera JEL478]
MTHADDSTHTGNRPRNKRVKYPLEVPANLTLDTESHVTYIKELDNKKDTLEYWVTEHLRLSGVYWGLTALAIMGRKDELDREQVIEFVVGCQHRSGGFGGSREHDPHMLYTLSALQILAVVDALDAVDREKVMQYVLSLGNPDGSFRGDEWGEVDSRFAYIALQCAALVEAADRKYGVGVWRGSAQGTPKGVGGVEERVEGGERGGTASQPVDAPSTAPPPPSQPESLTSPPPPQPSPSSSSPHANPPKTSRLGRLDTDLIASWVLRCKNFDGGFGNVPGAESHAGHIFTCVASLAICGRLDLVDRDLLGWWLAERQLANGGLNGRPEKLEDVCYSWWVLSSLQILGRDHWIDSRALAGFILSCQDSSGGFSDRPPDMPDVFHTLFAIAALSMIGYPGLNAVDPVYCLPTDVSRKLGMVVEWG